MLCSARSIPITHHAYFRHTTPTIRDKAGFTIPQAPASGRPWTQSSPVQAHAATHAFVPPTDAPGRALARPFEPFVDPPRVKCEPFPDPSLLAEPHQLVTPPLTPTATGPFRSHKGKAKSKGKSKSKARDPDHVPRPPNSFILFANSLRAKANGANMRNTSRSAADEWKSMTEEEKQPWKALATAAKDKHHKEHPGYRYKPKRVAAGSGPDASASASADDGAKVVRRSRSVARQMSATPESSMCSTPSTPGSSKRMKLEEVNMELVRFAAARSGLTPPKSPSTYTYRDAITMQPTPPQEPSLSLPGEGNSNIHHFDLVCALCRATVIDSADDIADRVVLRSSS